ncbi:VOC family protein [Phenylobacterium sp.]|uniref:VOC family protein n=1 Tax=Phenylobacterium sp. TaxID=1871053 RepID=UPI00351F1A99
MDRLRIFGGYGLGWTSPPRGVQRSRQGRSMTKTSRSRSRSRPDHKFVPSPWASRAARIVALGGTARDIHEAHTVMLDPEGAAFCVQDPRE